MSDSADPHALLSVLVQRRPHRPKRGSGHHDIVDNAQPIGLAELVKPRVECDHHRLGTALV